MSRARASLVAGVAATTLLMAPCLGAQSKEPLDFGTAGGTVNAVAVGGGNVYLGGTFTDGSAPTGRFAVVDDVAGGSLAGWPRVSGDVNAVTPDGAGGWYIGGLITAVGGVPRNGLAHILADGRLSSWNPSVSGGAVTAIVLHYNKVYLGGGFTSVGGPRRGLAAVDAATGVLDPWNPQANSGASVDDLALAGDVLYVAGAFTSFDSGASPRNGLAAFDLTSGALDPLWNPNADDRVRALRVSGSTVYVGGAFLNVGGLPRNRLAELRAVGVGLGQGSATAWTPSVDNGSVYSIALQGAVVYVSGDFTSAGAPAIGRNRLAAFDAGTGALDPWNPNVTSGLVTRVEAQAAGVYVTGSFATVAGVGRRGFARLDPTSAAAHAWDPSASGSGLTLFVDGLRVALGGTFEALGTRARQRLAAFDLATGKLTGWAPAADGVVNALASFNTDVFVGGSFTSITDGSGSNPRNRLARIDATGAVDASFVPNVTAGAVGVSDLLLAGTTPDVFVAGGFGSINGNLNAARLGKLDGTTGALDLAFLTPTPPAPGPLGAEVSGLALAGGVLYAGGTFTTVGGQARNRLAALDPANGVLDASWNPNAGNTVNALAAAADVFAGGSFTQVNGATARNRLAAFGPAVLASGTDLGTATGWNPDSNGTVNSIAHLANGRLAVGGTFTSLNTAPVALRNRLASVDLASATAAPWNPDVNGAVNAVLATSTHVFAGGSFTAVGGKPRDNFAAFCLHEPPSVLTASPAVGDNRIDLSWSAAGPSYRVYRGLFTGGPYQEIGTTTALGFSDTSADGGVTYRYVVRTDNGACLSDRSVEAVAATSGACNLAPAFEGAISAAPAAGATCAVTLVWLAATPFCGTGVRYSVYRSSSSASVPALSNRVASALSATSYVDASALSPASAYYYIVRASHDANGHEDGNLIRLRFDTGSCTQTAPEPVPVFTVSSSGTQNVLDWLQPVTGYNQTMVRVCSATSLPACASQSPQTSSDGALVTIQGGLPGTPDVFTHSGLNNGETYRYAAFADDGTGNYSTLRSSWGRPDVMTNPVQWGFASGASALSPVAVSPNNVYLAVSNDRQVHAMRAGSAGGNWPLAWTPLALNGPGQGRPTLVNVPVGGASRVALVGSQDGRVYAVNADTGAPLWTSSVLGEAVQAPPSVMATALGGAFNLVFAATRNVGSANRLYALNLTDGTLAWTFDNGGSLDPALAIGIISGQPLVQLGANRLYFASRRRAGGSLNTLWALSFDAASATLLWAYNVGDVDGAVSRLGTRVYVGTNEGRVYALDAASGSMPWVQPYRVPGGVPIQALVNPVQIGTSLRLFVTSNGRMFCIEDIGSDYALYWPASGVTVPGASPPTVRPPWVYVGGSNSQLYGINGNDPNPTPLAVTVGDPLVPKQVGRPTFDTAQLLLLVGTDQGAIYAISAFP